MVYDKYGRIISKKLPELTTTYTYNNNGFLDSESSNNATSRTYTYDEYGRLKNERDSVPDKKWLEKTYAYSGGNLSSIEFKSQAGTIGKEAYSYTNGHLSEIKLGATSIWKLSAENSLGLSETAVTGPLTRSYHYDKYGIPTGRKTTNTSSGTTLQNYSYSFDAAKGNLTSRTDNTRSKKETFFYDNLNRLKEYTGLKMEYDVKGNITNKFDVGNAFYYNTSGKPYAISGVYAGTNRAIPPRNQSVAYTSFERPKSITENNHVASFTYDGAGGRKKMLITYNGSTHLQRHYLGDRYEADSGTSNHQRLYIGGDAYSAPAVYVNQGSSWSLYYICRDYLGSITHVVNSSGAVTQESSYDPWGRLRNPSNQDVYLPGNEPSLFLHRGYTGHEHLTMFGLINMNARLYDPAVGRFLSADPYVQAADFSQSFNRYSYCMNNPLKFTDPDGELAWFVIPVVAAVIGGTTNLVANWNNVNGFWQGLATFGVGAGAGFATAATAGAGATALGVAGVAAASSSITGATNSIVSQTGTNFSGFNTIDWGQVGVSSAVSGVAGFAGSAAGSWAANSSWVVNGISHPLAKAAVVSPLAAGAGHIAGGTTAGLFQGQSLNQALANSLNGIGQSMALGGAVGVGTTAGMLYANGINPWTGNRIGAKSQIRALPQFSNTTLEEATSIVTNDKNKLCHLFPSKHNLDPVVNVLGGRENTIRAVFNAANGKLPSTGLFYNIPVEVQGYTIFIRGNVIDGVPRIGTMFIP